MKALAIQRAVPLAPWTTLELGGVARYFLEVTTAEALHEAYLWAAEQAVPVVVLGGGSNVVVADEGFGGLVLRMRLAGLAHREERDDRWVEAAAGESWDGFVAHAVERGWAGVECLSGIPGTVGATPIQNVSAYGQEVADTLTSVRVLDLARLEHGHDALRELEASELALGYRTSRLKREPDRFVVLSATFRLREGAPCRPAYRELREQLGDTTSIADARRSVLALRSARSMLLDAGDPNRRSVGSFFVNVVVSQAHADELVALSLERGFVRHAHDVPCYPAGEGLRKLPAAWLIEKSGIERGLRRGPVGVSTKHSLCLVHHGGGRTRDLLELARHIQTAVEDTFGLRLEPEPRMIGFDAPPLDG